MIRPPKDDPGLEPVRPLPRTLTAIEIPRPAEPPMFIEDRLVPLLPDGLKRKPKKRQLFGLPSYKAAL